MINKERKILVFLDLLELFLLLVALIIFTLIFCLDVEMTRYLFLLGDLYVLFSFSTTLSHLEGVMKKRVVRNSKVTIEPKYMKKISINKGY